MSNPLSTLLPSLPLASQQLLYDTPPSLSFVPTPQTSDPEAPFHPLHLSIFPILRTTSPQPPSPIASLSYIPNPIPDQPPLLVCLVINPETTPSDSLSNLDNLPPFLWINPSYVPQWLSTIFASNLQPCLNYYSANNTTLFGGVHYVADRLRGTTLPFVQLPTLNELFSRIHHLAFNPHLIDTRVNIELRFDSTPDSDLTLQILQNAATALNLPSIDDFVHLALTDEIKKFDQSTTASINSALQPLNSTFELNPILNHTSSVVSLAEPGQTAFGSAPCPRAGVNPLRGTAAQYRSPAPLHSLLLAVPNILPLISHLPNSHWTISLTSSQIPDGVSHTWILSTPNSPLLSISTFETINWSHHYSNP